MSDMIPETPIDITPPGESYFTDPTEIPGGDTSDGIAATPEFSGTTGWLRLDPDVDGLDH